MILLNFRVHRAGIESVGVERCRGSFVVLANVVFLVAGGVRIVIVRGLRFRLLRTFDIGPSPQKFLATILAAEIMRLAMEFYAQTGSFVDLHTTNWINGHVRPLLLGRRLRAGQIRDNSSLPRRYRATHNNRSSHSDKRYVACEKSNGVRGRLCCTKRIFEQP